MKKIILNYEFKLKDYEATKERHLGAIKRLKKAIKDNGVDIEWGSFQEMVEYYAKDTGFYNLNILDKENGWVNKLTPKQNLRMRKTFINEQTRQQISRILEEYELPKSWDTAFYCLYYKKINAIMKRLAKYYII